MCDHLLLARVPEPVDDERVRITRLIRYFEFDRLCNLGSSWSVLRTQLATSGIVDAVLAHEAGTLVRIDDHSARVLSAAQVNELHRALANIPDNACDRVVRDEARELGGAVLRSVLGEMRVLVRAAVLHRQAILALRCPPDPEAPRMLAN